MVSIIIYGRLASFPIVRIELLIINRSLTGKALIVVVGMRNKIGGAVFAVLLWIDETVETFRLRLKSIKDRMFVLILVHCWSARFEPVARLLKLLLTVLALVRILRHILLVEGH